MSFEELLATHNQQKAAPTTPADDFIDIDRESSPEPEWDEMDKFIGRMRSTQSQTSSKPASQARVDGKKPRSSVGNAAKSDSVSSAKPVSKSKVICLQSSLLTAIAQTKFLSRAHRIPTPRKRKSRSQLPRKTRARFVIVPKA